MENHGKAALALLCHSTSNVSPLSTNQNSPPNEPINMAYSALPGKALLTTAECLLEYRNWA